MIIPSRFRIGRVHYGVYHVDKIALRRAVGLIEYDRHKVILAARSNVNGRTLTSRKRTEVFWHEVVHGVLHDMKHKLRDDEAFVEAVAVRLADVVLSARL